MLEFSEVGALGARGSARIGCAQSRERDHLGALEIELLEVGPNHQLTAHRRARTEYRVPARTVLAELHDAVGAHREDRSRADVLAHGRQDFFSHDDVGYAEVAREQLDVGQRAAFPERQDARHRRQLGERFGQEVDAISFVIVAGRLAKHAAREARVEGAQARADLPAEEFVLDPCELVRIENQAVDHGSVEEQGAAAHPILGVEVRERLDLESFATGIEKSNASHRAAHSGARAR